MKRRTPWALITITVAVLGAVGGLVSSTDAFYSPLVYQYLNSPSDTFIADTTALTTGGAATDSVTIVTVRRVAGAAGGYGVDTLGIADRFILATDTAVQMYLYMNGETTPIRKVIVGANTSYTDEMRWIDSIRVKSRGSAANIKLYIGGHKQWFSGGGTY